MSYCALGTSVARPRRAAWITPAAPVTPSLPLLRRVVEFATTAGRLQCGRRLLENLIKTLHAQHRAIATVADEITAQLAAGNTQEVRSGLVRLKNELVAHLELEDAHLYPVLTKVAEATKSLVSSRVALTYERNMQHVSAALRAFLEQYTSNEDVRIEELRLDWNLVVRMLLDRIESEEEQLYPLYEEWVLGNADR